MLAKKEEVAAAEVLHGADQQESRLERRAHVQPTRVRVLEHDFA